MNTSTIKELKAGTKLTINQICELTTLYRMGVCVPELATKFNIDYGTVVKLGVGGKASVFDRNGKILFSGYEIECDEYCDKNPKKWGSVISRPIV